MRRLVWKEPVAAPIPEQLLRVGATFNDRFKIIDVIRSGGMGTVYKACNSATHGYCALKTMHPDLEQDSDFRTRFELEAHVTSLIESDHIVRVYDSGVDEKTSMPFLVMELLKGDDLGSILGKQIKQ